MDHGGEVIVGSHRVDKAGVTVSDDVEIRLRPRKNISMSAAVDLNSGGSLGV